MKTLLDHAALKSKQRALRGGFPQAMSLRVHRAISWIGRAETEGEDDDARFLFLWIAFNATYAGKTKFQYTTPIARDTFQDFFEKIVTIDSDERIYRTIWQNFSGPIRILIQNRYLYGQFWKHHNGINGFDNWEKKFNESKCEFNKLLVKKRRTVHTLKFLFDRLYVLRNQLIHGEATWNSDVNRDQVRDGARILGFLMPVFVDVMMDNPSQDWGQPFYPVVD